MSPLHPLCLPQKRWQVAAQAAWAQNIQVLGSRALDAHTRESSSGTGGLLSSESLHEQVFGVLPPHTVMKTCWLPHLHRATSWPTRTILKLFLSPCNWISWANVVALIFVCLFLMTKYLVLGYFHFCLVSPIQVFTW